MSIEEYGITVRCTKGDFSLEMFIEEQLLLNPENSMYGVHRDQLITAAKERLASQPGPDEKPMGADADFQVIYRLKHPTKLPMDWGKQFQFECGYPFEPDSVEHYVPDDRPGIPSNKCGWSWPVGGDNLLEVIDKCRKHAEECNFTPQ